jgi:hypothetical protein
MKRNIAFWFVVVVLSLTLVVPAQQPTSRVIPFTGYIPGQQDGDVALRFRFFPAITDRTFVFEETQTVTVSGEAFSVLLGNNTAGGLPSAIFADNPSLWIAFVRDAMPDMEIGDRTPINGRGYAFKAVNADVANRANNAERLGDVPSDGYIRTTGGSMSGSSSTSILSVTNTGSGATGIFANTGGGDLIQGKRSASDPTPVFRLFNNGGAYFGGNVGIGTTGQILSEKLSVLTNTASWQPGIAVRQQGVGVASYMA